MDEKPDLSVCESIYKVFSPLTRTAFLCLDRSKRMQYDKTLGFSIQRLDIKRVFNKYAA